MYIFKHFCMRHFIASYVTSDVKRYGKVIKARLWSWA